MTIAFLALVSGLIATLIALGRQHEAELRVRNSLAQVERLADGLAVRDAFAGAESLYPRVPEQAEAMRRWLVRSRELVGRLPLHEEFLARLEAVSDGSSDLRTRWMLETSRQLVASLRNLPALIAEVEERERRARTLEERSVEAFAADWSEVLAAIAESPR